MLLLPLVVSQLAALLSGEILQRSLPLAGIGLLHLYPPLAIFIDGILACLGVVGFQPGGLLGIVGIGPYCISPRLGCLAHVFDAIRELFNPITDIPSSLGGPFFHSTQFIQLPSQLLCIECNNAGCLCQLGILVSQPLNRTRRQRQRRRRQWPQRTHSGSRAPRCQPLRLGNLAPCLLARYCILPCLRAFFQRHSNLRQCFDSPTVYQEFAELCLEVGPGDGQCFNLPYPVNGDLAA